MLTEKSKRITIDSSYTLLECLRKMDGLGVKLLIMLSSGNYFEGLITIGDIQRAIIANKSLETPAKEILRQNIHVAIENEDIEVVKSNMLRQKDECMPVLNTDGFLVDVIFWDDIFSLQREEKNHIGIPVVIMAGGKGTRMRPITYVIPKPLIPINGVTILEDIISNFMQNGCNRFYLSVNYKAEFIKFYMNQLPPKEYNLSYFQEDKPLGTAGSLTLLKNEIDTTFFVSNCDILIKEDYYSIYEYHKEHKNEITIIGAIKQEKIPYGTLKSGVNGELLSMKEKPDVSYLINTGMYVLEPHVLSLIPEGEFFHITHLISKIKERSGKVGVFPISDKQYIDIGEWRFYKDTILNI